MRELIPNYVLVRIIVYYFTSVISFYHRYSFGRKVELNSSYKWVNLRLKRLNNLPKFRKVGTSQKRDWNKSLLISQVCWYLSQMMNYNRFWRECLWKSIMLILWICLTLRIQWTVEATRGSSSKSLWSLSLLSGFFIKIRNNDLCCHQSSVHWVSSISRRGAFKGVRHVAYVGMVYTLPLLFFLSP